MNDTGLDTLVLLLLVCSRCMPACNLVRCISHHTSITLISHLPSVEASDSNPECW